MPPKCYQNKCRSNKTAIQITELQKIQNTEAETTRSTQTNNHRENRSATKRKILCKCSRANKEFVKYRHDPDENHINISKNLYYKGTCNLLNKNLNFISIPNLYNLDFKFQNFYCSIKLKSYLKEAEQQKETNREEQMFKSRVKDRWTPQKQSSRDVL